jgi:hypothetical protein
VRVASVKSEKERTLSASSRKRAIDTLGRPHICQFYDSWPDYLLLDCIECRPFMGPLRLIDGCPCRTDRGYISSASRLIVTIRSSRNSSCFSDTRLLLSEPRPACYVKMYIARSAE